MLDRSVYRIISSFAAFILAGLGFHGVAQIPMNAFQIGGADFDALNDAVYDSYGSLLCTGQYQGTIDFDPGPGVNMVAGGIFGSAYVAKYGASMTPLWVDAFGGGGARGLAIGVDGSNSTVVAGDFGQFGDFDPGPGTLIFQAVDATDIFVAKVDANGVLQWAHQLGDSTYDRASDLALDAAASVYLVGHINDTCDVDPGPGVFTWNALGPFVIKFDANGLFQWADGFRGYDAYAIEVDPASGNLLVLMDIAGQMDVDPGPGTLLLNEVDGAFGILELDPNGALVWAHQTEAVPVALVADDAGDIYLTGSIYGTLDLDPGAGVTTVTSSPNGDGFLSKLDPSGNLIWTRIFGAGTGSIQGRGLALTDLGHVLVIGWYGGVVDLDPGSGTWTATYGGENDGFISMFDATGLFLGATTAVGSGETLLSDITVSPTGSLAAFGTFEQDMSFLPLPAPAPMISAGLDDGFLILLNDVVNAVHEQGSMPVLELWPQPASTEVHIQGLPPDAEWLELLDVSGRMLDRWPADRHSGTNTLDLGFRAGGTYCLRVIGRATAHAVPLIIAR